MPAALSVRKTASALTLIGAAVALLVAPAAASGQQGPPAEEQQENRHVRDGFWFNGGLGWGSLGCDGCGSRESSAVITLGVGGTLSQKVTLGASINGWGKEEGGATVTASTLAATLRFYPSATGGFFLLGGLGYGTVEVEISGVGSAEDTGPAAVLGLGYDFRVSDNVSLTPFLNGVGISFEGGDVNFNQLGLSVTTH